MTNRQYAQVNAARCTLEVFYKDEEIIAPYEGITEIVGKVEDKIIDIEELVEAQERDKTGVTENKEIARRNLVDIVMIVSGKLMPLGKAKNDADLVQRASATKSDWLRVPQSKLAERAGGMLTLAQNHQTVLAKYGPIEQNITTLEAQIKAFKEELTKPRDVINRRKTTTTQIRKETGNLMRILRDELDPLMREFEASHPKFFQDYHNARALVSMPVIPQERRAAARQRVADHKAEVAQRRLQRAELSKLRKESAAKTKNAAGTAGLSS